MYQNAKKIDKLAAKGCGEECLYPKLTKLSGKDVKNLEDGAKISGKTISFKMTYALKDNNSKPFKKQKEMIYKKYRPLVVGIFF